MAAHQEEQDLLVHAEKLLDSALAQTKQAYTLILKASTGKPRPWRSKKRRKRTYRAAAGTLPILIDELELAKDTLEELQGFSNTPKDFSDTISSLSAQVASIAQTLSGYISTLKTLIEEDISISESPSDEGPDGYRVAGTQRMIKDFKEATLGLWEVRETYSKDVVQAYTQHIVNDREQ